jgi:hypothetical protein
MTRLWRRTLAVTGIALLGAAAAIGITVVRTMREIAQAKTEAEALDEKIRESLRQMPKGRDAGPKYEDYDDKHTLRSGQRFPSPKNSN